MCSLAANERTSPVAPWPTTSSSTQAMNAPFEEMRVSSRSNSARRGMAPRLTDRSDAQRNTGLRLASGRAEHQSRRRDAGAGRDQHVVDVRDLVDGCSPGLAHRFGDAVHAVD